MSIQVISNQPKPAEQSAEPKAETSSAPANEAEQKDPANSGSAETEAKEESEENSNSEAESEKDEAEDQEEDSDSEKPKRPTQGFKKRIDKLRARASRAEQELEYWKNLALKEKGAADPKKEEVEKPKPAAESNKPNPDDFETHSEYVEALTDWKLEQREKARSEKQEKERLQKEQETVLQTHSDRVKAFSKEVKDYEEVIAEIDDIVFPAAALDAITSSELGPQIAYELAKNREEAERIAKLPPGQVYREIGKLEAKLEARASASVKPEPKKTTQAPPPPTPIGSGKSTVPKRLEDAKTQAEYEAIRREQMKRRAPSW